MPFLSLIWHIQTMTGTSSICPTLFNCREKHEEGESFCAFVQIFCTEIAFVVQLATITTTMMRLMMMA